MHTPLAGNGHVVALDFNAVIEMWLGRLRANCRGDGFKCFVRSSDCECFEVSTWPGGWEPEGSQKLNLPAPCWVLRPLA